MSKYNTIYADPPWSYDNKKTGRALNGTGANMAADDKYNTMSLQDLCDLPVRSVTEKDCILFMWAVVPMMPEAFKVIESWGFQYKTMLTWRVRSCLRGWDTGSGANVSTCLWLPRVNPKHSGNRSAITGNVSMISWTTRCTNRRLVSTVRSRHIFVI